MVSPETMYIQTTKIDSAGCLYVFVHMLITIVTIVTKEKEAVNLMVPRSGDGDVILFSYFLNLRKGNISYHTKDSFKNLISEIYSLFRVGVFCLDVCTCTKCMFGTPKRLEKGTRFPEAGVAGAGI